MPGGQKLGDLPMHRFRALATIRIGEQAGVQGGLQELLFGALYVGERDELLAVLHCPYRVTLVAA